MYPCPNCHGSLPPSPPFGVEWRCPSCRQMYLAVGTPGTPQALDAHHGVYAWTASGQPILIKPSVPEWMTVRCAVAEGAPAYSPAALTPAPSPPPP